MDGFFIKSDVTHFRLQRGTTTCLRPGLWSVRAMLKPGCSPSASSGDPVSSLRCMEWQTCITTPGFPEAGGHPAHLGVLELPPGHKHYWTRGISSVLGGNSLIPPGREFVFSAGEELKVLWRRDCLPRKVRLRTGSEMSPGDLPPSPMTDGNVLTPPTPLHPRWPSSSSLSKDLEFPRSPGISLTAQTGLEGRVGGEPSNQ